MRILGMTALEDLAILAAYLVLVLALYWTVRFAVKHGIKDALDERAEEET